MLSPISTVLVVDDNPMARATAVRLFQDLGFTVVDAYNGQAALRLIERHFARAKRDDSPTVDNRGRGTIHAGAPNR
jgi:CheY-like chemotaxis protein